MVELLALHTAMQVVQVADGMLVECDHVYLNPPSTYLAIAAGTLRLSKPLERHGARMPFDFFLRSLAQECGQRAICAILSGTGTDGSLGLKVVKEKGGLVIVQDPEEAAFDGMPRSAIVGGGADLVLPVAKIPHALVRFGRQNYVQDGSKSLGASDTVQAAFADIIDLLAANTPHDFSLYKQSTLQRRIERRMAMVGLESSARYLRVLLENSAERELLAKDLLINVTHFFRDPAAFALLSRQIIPDIVQQQTLDRPLRIWVPGCSTGEEAYSITMLFLEQIGATKRNIKLQVFASDIDADCVAFARNGIYPESIEADVAPRRLARFFTKEDHSYQVVRELRETVVFTGQSLLADAPFSGLDLVSCRNLFIYLSAETQRRNPVPLSLRAPPGRCAISRFLRECGQRLGSLRADQHKVPRIPSRQPQPARRGRISTGKDRSPSLAGWALAAAAGAAPVWVRGTITASLARSLCAGLRPDQREARGPLLFRLGGSLSENCLRRGYSRCAGDGARGIARQVEIGNSSRRRRSGACHRYRSAHQTRRAVGPSQHHCVAGRRRQRRAVSCQLRRRSYDRSPER